MINEDISNKLVNLEIRMGKATAKELIKVMRKLFECCREKGETLTEFLDDKVRGNSMPLKDLVKRGGVDNITLKENDFKEIKKELNKYGVKLGNCDTTLFLGGKERTMLKEISESLGKETIELYNTSETRSNQKSFGLNYQKLGKDLMSVDDLSTMDGGKCIYLLRGVRGFISKKYDITKHRNYKYLYDYDEKNKFDINKYIRNKSGVKFKKNMMVTRIEVREVD